MGYMDEMLDLAKHLGEATALLEGLTERRLKPRYRAELEKRARVFIERLQKEKEDAMPIRIKE